VILTIPLVAAINEGLSCRAAAVRFGVSAASAIRWRALVRRQGDARPGPLGGDRRRLARGCALIPFQVSNTIISA
jgi:transposase